MTDKRQINLRLKEEKIAEVKQQADKENRSLNNMIEVMIEEYLKNHSK